MCTDEAGRVNRSDTNLAQEPRQPQVCPESGCCETAETLSYLSSADINNLEDKKHRHFKG